MIDPTCMHVLTPTARAVCLRVFNHTRIYSGLAENVFCGLRECSKRVKPINAFKGCPLAASVCVCSSVAAALCLCNTVCRPCTALFYFEFCSDSSYFTLSSIKAGFLMKISNKFGVKDFQKQDSWQHTAILLPWTFCDRQHID